MKIAFVSQPIDGVIPPNQSSIGICTYQMARRLARDNDVTVFLRRVPTQNTADDSGIHFRFVRTMPSRRFWERVQSFPWLSSGARRPFFATAFYFVEYATQVATALRRGAYDIIHIQNSPHFVPIIRALNPQAKIVLHMHCEWLSQLDRALMEKRLRGVDVVIGCSSHVTEKIRERFPQMAARCATIPNGVDLERFSPSPNGHTRKDEPHLLFVGRVSPEKGVHVLMDAFRKVHARFPNARLNLVGHIGSAPLDFLVGLSDSADVAQLSTFYDAPYIDDLRARIPAALAANVNFVGPVPQVELAACYRDADVLVNPSFSESFGMSLIEAMACARPVVATRVGGMTDIVEDGETGLLVEPGNPDELAEAIIQVLEDPQRGQAMGQAGLRRAQTRFSWEHVTADLLAHYQRALGETR